MTATLRCLRSSTRRQMYSFGMLGSCLEKIVLRAISLQAAVLPF